MKKKLWFRAKDYGWGWRPQTWEGWFVIVVYLLVLYAVLIKAGEIDDGMEFMKEVGVPLAVMTVVLVYISAKKGEKPEWRWRGKPLKKK